MAALEQETISVTIPFNKPYLTGQEAGYIAEAMASGHLEGDGPFTQRCAAWLERWSGVPNVLMTHSCTAALEMAALLLEIQPGDEAIMPSYTFVSTANAFVLRGGVPVFVDIRPDTLNLDERLVEAAITPRTRAIVAVHYAGVACEMDALRAIAERHGLALVEDAAQGVLASYKGRALGAIGHLGALSFHATKNVISGEGGALLIGDRRYKEAAEIIREKGTNRQQFLRGAVDKYTWQAVGSSYLPSELVMAFLMAQMEAAEAITRKRLEVWAQYHEMLAPLEASGRLTRPVVPDGCEHNAHMYYIVLQEHRNRETFITRLKEEGGVQAVSHYVPLHNAAAGLRHGRPGGDLSQTERIAGQIVRLPLWVGLSKDDVSLVGTVVESALE